LINTVRLRWLGELLGFEKLTLKNETLRAYFITNNDAYFSSEVFGKILSYVQKHPRQFKMKDSSGKAMLLMTQIKNVDAAIELLNHLADQPIKSSSEIFSR
jgi:transcription-repair coupling factor (superfamily II helicase)